jgi:L-fuculose-phosphate aldolase
MEVYDTDRIINEHPGLFDDFLAGFAILDADGQNSGIAGHLTARIADSDQLLAHRYGLGFNEVTQAAVRVTDFSLDAARRGDVSPSLAFHVALYRARSDIGAIVHSHPESAIAFSTTGIPFQPVYQSALMLYGRVTQYDEYDGIIEDEKLGRKFAEKLGDGQILLLKNHGLIAVGPSIRHAVCAAVIFHQNCRIYLQALAAGKPSGFDDHAGKNLELAQAAAFLNQDSIIDMRWNQLARQSARVDMN